MTENEAIKNFQQELKEPLSPFSITMCNMAIKALEEIQQYRAIGTVEECELAINEGINKHNLMIVYKDKLKDYEAIGTIEDFKALKEKSVAKKAEYDNDDEIYICPSCGKSVGEHQNYCWHCGQSFET